MNRASHCRGYTLPEIFITLGIVAIVLSMAVPSVTKIIMDNRLVTHLNSVVADIHFARSEAVKRDVRVIMCRSPNPDLPVPTCGGTNFDWDTGYIVFADNGQYANNVYNNGTDILLRRSLPGNADVNMRTNANWNNNLEFNADGSTNEGGIALMSFCDTRGKQNGKQIQVTQNGIPKLFTGAIDDCTPGDPP
jgi:type IV fimbrial biogenesis protein FimT